MSLQTMVGTTRCSLWTASTSKDASGGVILTPFVISPTFQGLPSTIQTASTEVKNRFKQAQLDVSNSIFFLVNIGALPQQIIKEDSTGRTFVIAGFEESTAGRMRINMQAWVAHVRETK